MASLLNSQNKNYLLLVVLFIPMLTGCSLGEKKEPADTDRDLVKRADMSELALLMRRMEKLTAQWKEATEKGNYTDIELPDWLEKIHTAEATDPSEITGIYHPMATAWLESVRQFKDAPAAEKPKTFNTLVSNCITCHQHYCQGPIPRIKKLYVEPSTDVSNR
ncbi:hypothetical protein AT05_04400 [Schleiferia thermophila str. Yellowstone]|nr:hypothetical protein AT05_04400 [Schleiferia thermophila str. Yellowstone]